MEWQCATPTGPKAPRLTDDAVHVWTWPRQPDDAAPGDDSILSVEEHTRLRQFRFDADRNRYRSDHVNLRTVLAGYLECEPAALSFCTNPWGKPSLTMRGQPLQFNLSHSHRTAMLAVSSHMALGLDVEDTQPVDPGLARLNFSAAENLDLAGCSGDTWLQSFFRCWTRKEAILKAEGIGLNARLDAFDVSLLPGVPAKLLGVRAGSGLTCHWRLDDVSPAAQTIAALAAPRQARVQAFQLIRE